ncbi:MAG: hypothetical protein R6V49_06860 [Bacteroidales bacterium]
MPANSTKVTSHPSIHLVIRALLVSFFALVFSPGFTQVTTRDANDHDPDSIMYLNGRVANYLTHNGLFQVHIINLSRNRATLSDRFGYFTLEARLYDTIYFSHVGFKKRLYRLSPSELDSGSIATIYMYEDTIMLKKFRLLSASREVQFKSDFISRPFIPDTLNPAFEAFIKENHFSAPTGGIVLPGPFTIIYENFNRGARLKRRIERNREQYFENLPEEEKQKVLFFDD